MSQFMCLLPVTLLGLIFLKTHSIAHVFRQLVYIYINFDYNCITTFFLKRDFVLFSISPFLRYLFFASLKVLYFNFGLSWPTLP